MLFKAVLFSAAAVALMLGLGGYVMFRAFSIRGEPPSSRFLRGDVSVSYATPRARSLAMVAAPALVDIEAVEARRPLEGEGTGMVLTGNGLVLTNNHVVTGASTITAWDVGNDTTYQATVVGYDRAADVAVLRLSGASGLRTVSIGDSDTVRAGTAVVAVGNAEGTGGTPSFSAGAISAVDQSVSARDKENGAVEQLSGLFETSADIVPGDSGGVLLNGRGQVVGMITARAGGSRHQSVPAGGFAIPIDRALSIADRIESHEGIRVPRLPEGTPYRAKGSPRHDRQDPAAARLPAGAGEPT